MAMKRLRLWFFVRTKHWFASPAGAEAERALGQGLDLTAYESLLMPVSFGVKFEFLYIRTGLRKLSAHYRMTRAVETGGNILKTGYYSDSCCFGSFGGSPLVGKTVLFSENR